MKSAAMISVERKPIHADSGPASAMPAGLTTSEITQSNELTRESTSPGRRDATTDHHTAFRYESPAIAKSVAAAITHVAAGCASRSSGTADKTRLAFPATSGLRGLCCSA